MILNFDLSDKAFKSRVHETKQSYHPTTPPSPVEKEIEDEASYPSRVHETMLSRHPTTPPSLVEKEIEDEAPKTAPSKSPPHFFQPH